MVTQERAAGPWFLRFHPAPEGGPRLVCFPHAGGAASYYFPLSRMLSPGVEVLAVQYPGRHDRYSEPHIEDLGTLADEITSALQPWRDRPAALFGHSMGAMLAFEVARRLEADGGPAPLRVVVSGRRAPSRHREESYHLRDDRSLIAAVRALNGTDSAVFDDEELLRLTLPTLRSDYKAAETFRSDPGAVVRAPLTVLTGDDDPRTTPEEAAAWKAHTTSDCDFHTFPGGHFFLTDHRAEIAALLTRSLGTA